MQPETTISITIKQTHPLLRNRPEYQQSFQLEDKEEKEKVSAKRKSVPAPISVDTKSIKKQKTEPEYVLSFLGKRERLIS